MIKLKSGDIFYEMDDFPFHEIYEEWKDKLCYKKGKYKAAYYNYPCSFDIETTSINGDEPYGFMYAWMFNAFGCCILGRTWEEFVRFFDKLNKTFHTTKNKKIVVYCHNLFFEFQFMRSFIPITEPFYKDVRKPLKFTSKGCEFRCSYALSNMSLQKFCENSALCVHNKLSGNEYDYSVIRTPVTKLNDMEMQYQYNDVAGLSECVCSLMESYGDDMSSIPLTNTGYVRRDVKKAMKKNPKNRSSFIRNKLTIENYEFLRKIFRGGDTHANRFFADILIKCADSYDMQSSYPACMDMDYYPIGKLCQIRHTSAINYYKDKKCLFLKLGFYNLRIKTGEPHAYMDIGHSEHYRKIVGDNGRILYAEYVEYYCTEIDLEIIDECYDYDGYILLEGYMCSRGVLPEEIKEVLRLYYDKKTTLKDIVEKIYEYMKSKNQLNSLFGMMVSAIIHDIIEFNGKEWSKEKGDPEELEKFYRNGSGFLSYYWGIYITAHGRRRLREGIRQCVGKDGVSKALYWDTDSVKFIHDFTIRRKFKEINKRLMETKGIYYAEKNGKKYYLGVWEQESYMLGFKTLGAKKYCYRTLEHGKIVFHSTVSGMNKEKGAKAIEKFNPIANPIDNFQIGAVYHDVGRNVSYYNDDPQIHTIKINGCEITTGANIGIVETTYTLGITNEYENILKIAKKGKEYEYDYFNGTTGSGTRSDD